MNPFLTLRKWFGQNSKNDQELDIRVYVEVLSRIIFHNPTTRNQPHNGMHSNT